MQIYLQKGRNFINTVSRNTGISVPRRELGGTSPSTGPIKDKNGRNRKARKKMHDPHKIAGKERRNSLIEIASTEHLLGETSPSTGPIKDKNERNRKARNKCTTCIKLRERNEETRLSKSRAQNTYLAGLRQALDR